MRVSILLATALFAFSAVALDYNVILATDSIASYDDEYHRESTRYLAQSIGRPMTNGEIRESLRVTATQGYSKEQ